LFVKSDVIKSLLTNNKKRAS